MEDQVDAYQWNVRDEGEPFDLLFFDEETFLLAELVFLCICKLLVVAVQDAVMFSCISLMHF